MHVARAGLLEVGLFCLCCNPLEGTICEIHRGATMVIHRYMF